MILVCGSLADPVTGSVCATLEGCGFPYRLLNLADYPAGTRVNWLWKGAAPAGYITGEQWHLDLSEISAVYVRYLGIEERVSPKYIPREFGAFLHAECDAQLAALIESLPCPVVNRETGGVSNNSKPYQALQTKLSGFRIPLTLLTNDPAEARRFYEECEGRVVYKSISGVRSIVRRMNTEHLTRLSLLKNGPAQFQEFIPGDDIRVHVVGDQLFATRIRSGAVDYRYAYEEGQPVKMEPTVLPRRVGSSCLQVARRFQLLLAGIDLKETPAGDYYCLEVNPSPAFTVYEQGSGQPISFAVAEMLHSASSHK